MTVAREFALEAEGLGKAYRIYPSPARRIAATRGTTASGP